MSIPIALSPFARAVRSIVDAPAFGVVMPAGSDRSLFLTRHRAGGAAHLLPASAIPSMLTDVQAPSVVARLASALDASRAVDERLLRYGFQCLLVVPLPGCAGCFWIGKTGDEPFDARQIDSLIGIAAAVAAASRAEESDATRLERLTRLEPLERILELIAGALDVRDVFQRLSAIAKAVLPHDAATIQILDEDRARASLHALDGLDEHVVPETFQTNYSPLFNDRFLYSLHEDLRESPFERDRPTAKSGLRASLRVPLWFDDRVGGAVEFSAREPAIYTERDVAVARRIADYVTLALSHQRLAEAAATASRLESRVRQLTEELDARTGYRRVIGESDAWKHVLRLAAQVATTEATVLLLGESGTGKEVVARLVHRGSSRGSGPFIAVNCAALPEHLLEAELFGFERGAFTGAAQSKPGQIEQAAGGVLFLDEIAEMTPSAQAKFLRVLQEREFQRLGGTRVLRADVRFVAATNRDLQAAMKRGAFRDDLYYRLNVFELRLPPLRERRDDILPLSDAFVSEIGRSLGRPPAGISRDAREMLLRYEWPGNVRELRNILERAAILADGGLIVGAHLAIAPPAQPMVDAPSSPVGASSVSTLAQQERAMIEQALLQARFNKSVAARALGMTRAQLYTRMKRYRLD